jgi:Ca2+-binding RTX toxin-like protein
MKKAILILLAILAAQAATVAHAGETSYNVVLAGGAEQSMIRIWLTPDGRSYVIDSAAPLEVGGPVCENTPGIPNELICKAPIVAGFEVNSGIGNDSVTVAANVPAPVTMRGGPGNDTLTGGDGADKLIGGEGNDHLAGRGGADLIYGGSGNDSISGGPGKDILRGGFGKDVFGGATGSDSIRQDLRRL